MDHDNLVYRFAKGLPGEGSVSLDFTRIGVGTLQDYSRIFAGHSKIWNGATATIIPDPGNMVIGVLYLLDSDQERVLARFENADNHDWSGLANIHKKAEITVTGSDGNLYPAYTYIFVTGPPTSTPSTEYLAILDDAYRKIMNESLLRNYIRALLR